MFPSSGAIFDLPKLESQLAELDAEIANPNFWDDPNKARLTLSKATPIKKQIEAFAALEKKVLELDDLIELAREVDDEETTRETVAEFQSVGKEMDNFELLTLLRRASCSSVPT